MPASEFVIRETLDAAVRSLAVSNGTLCERLHVAGTIALNGLSPSDFAAEEDRELFDQIHTALSKLTPAAGRDALTSTVEAMSDVMAEQLASDILDLRDTAMGRAIHRSGDGAARTRGPRPRG